MGLNKPALKASIKQAFLDEYASTPTSEQSAAADRIAGKIADACDVFVKGATVTVAAGIPVATTGTAAAQTGATTAPGTASIT